jgi:hypothetical protein
MQSRDGPSCAANRFGCLFGITFPDYWLQTDSAHFVLDEYPVIRKVGY